MTDCVCECSRSLMTLLALWSGTQCMPCSGGHGGLLPFCRTLRFYVVLGHPVSCVQWRSAHMYAQQHCLWLRSALASLRPVEFNNKDNATAVKWFCMLQV